MACSDPSVNGESLQIIRFSSQTHEMELLEENLEKIMCHPDVKENPVQIISIAGAYRKGKSFIMGFFLKYLVAQQQDCEWLNENDKIEGFQWRGGCDRVTSGIHIWSKPLVYEKESGKKVAVLLMDTQGVFDNEATFDDCTCIFALSNLISSVQIYNTMHQLQEDDLQHLEIFAEFRNLISEQSDETGVSNSRLLFLIRDWERQYDYPNGNDGGDVYIRKILEIKSNHREELQKIRRNINKCFPNIDGFLLPHPGKAVVLKREYDGTVKDMDEDFVASVKLLVPYVLSRDKLVPKRINGRDVTGEDMLKYVKAFVGVLKTGKLPSPQTALQAITEIGRQKAIGEAIKLYEEEMDKVFNLANGGSLSETDLESYSEMAKELAGEKLKQIPRMQKLEHEMECLEQLDFLIKQKFGDFEIRMKMKNENMLLKKDLDKTKKIAIAASTVAFGTTAALAGGAGTAGTAGTAALVGGAGTAAVAGTAGTAAVAGGAGTAALSGGAGTAALAGGAGTAALPAVLTICSSIGIAIILASSVSKK